MTERYMRFSRRTLAALAQVISVHSHTEIDALAYELEMEHDAVGSNRLSRSIQLIKALERMCRSNGNDLCLANLTERILTDLADWPRDNQDVAGLKASLQADGFDFQGGRLIPTTPAPTSLSPEVSALEKELEDGGFSVAVRHYSQACDNLAKGNFEAANGQVRRPRIFRPHG